MAAVMGKSSVAMKIQTVIVFVQAGENIPQYYISTRVKYATCEARTNLGI